MGDPLTFFIIAGESSGDRLGAALMEGLKSEHNGEVRFVGIGGPLMSEQGLKSLFPIEELSVMGIAEILPKLRQLFKRVSETVSAIETTRPTALITIDSPDFCLRVAKRAKFKEPNLHVIHYVAPSVWAWRPKRAAKMARYVNHVLALLPFEPPYMEAEGMSCDFVGHPITTETQATDEQASAFRSELGMGNGGRLLTLLPGSRESEVSRLAPVFREVAERVKKEFPELTIAIPSVGARVERIEQSFKDLDFIILDPRGVSSDESEFRKRTCYRASDVALAASGTVSLELAASETPMVIAYKMHWLTAFVKRRLVRVSTATLVNLLTDSKAVPEFLLENCTADKIYPEVKRLLENSEARDAQLDKTSLAMKMLGKGDDASANRAAQSVLKYLKS